MPIGRQALPRAEPPEEDAEVSLLLRRASQPVAGDSARKKQVADSAEEYLSRHGVRREEIRI